MTLNEMMFVTSYMLQGNSMFSNFNTYFYMTLYLVRISNYGVHKLVLEPCGTILLNTYTAMTQM